ncbi:MAG: PmoA family protein [Verrucomicrobia bacterium]|nr:PmoA family protein [Verrucomicrobiota bacterium]
MKNGIIVPGVLSFCLSFLSAQDDFPIVPDDLEVSLFARDPLVRNPCAITFDAKGRLCVGMGPQYRRPVPETQGDSVWILIDEDGDGIVDSRKEFATSFNSIQGLVWKGDTLWVANSPDFTRVRDTDGDDKADEYIRVYTDLGNLEHALHGLNWGPDGKLYMSKGNSKGITRSPDRVAPKAFRELFGMPEPEGLPDFPEPVNFTAETYQRNYHNPSDDWGLNGGVLRSDPDGSNLEIVSRGNRNPFDIAFDSGFNWLGTDNDQNLGDKIFSSFYGANFGWGHPWSYDWKGDDHLPSAPSAGPLFEGSGAGVIYCDLNSYPEKYRGVFLINDWLSRKVYIYRPRWKGAWLQPEKENFDLLAHAGSGRSSELSAGRSFDPVDIEIGPDGAIYISSWGRQYGAEFEGNEMVNEGRIYRISPKEVKALKWNDQRDPWKDLGSHLPVWRVNAQELLVQRGPEVVEPLKKLLEKQSGRSEQLETWLAWTLARIDPLNTELDRYFQSKLQDTSLNLRVQVLRILAHRAQQRGDNQLHSVVRKALQDSEPRLRHEAILAIRRVGEKRWNKEVLKLAATELDRIVFYSVWGAMRTLFSQSELTSLLKDKRAGVRRAALLASLEDDALSELEIVVMSKDADPITSELARMRLGGKDNPVIKSLENPEEADTDLAYGKDVQSVVLDPIAVVLPSGEEVVEAALQPIVPVYSDGRERFSKVPLELIGETFIRRSNKGALAGPGTGLSLNLRYDSTVFLVYDKDANRLPDWARDRFKATSMEIKIGNSTCDIYQDEYPAGHADFGPNLEGNIATELGYVLIFRPHLLKPPSTPATNDESLALINQADPVRGRALFLSPQGSNCVSCHRMESRGNVFAPDLSDIGSRADATVLINSIIHPSDVIVEGFAMQTVSTRDGKSYAGVILEETGRALKFGMMGGTTALVLKSDITKRETLELSAMPDIFAATLSSQDVANLTAYLLSAQKKERDSSDKHEEDKITNSFRSVADPLSGRAWGDRQKGLYLRCLDDRLNIDFNGQLIASYVYWHDQTWRPFFARVKTTGGIQVTRNFPPIEGVDRTDHPFMHPGISLGFANLNGENYWHNRSGVVLHEGFQKEPVVTENTAEFSVRNRYLGQDGKTLGTMIADYTIVLNTDGYLLTTDLRFIFPQKTFFGVKEEMGLAMRMATPITVEEGNGSILSAAGGVDEEGTWGKIDRWWDYSGLIDGKHVGLQVMSAPDNPEVWSHSRDYGVLVANPFPIDIDENRDKKTWVDAGEVYRLRFGIQIHEHNQSADYNPDNVYQFYLNQVSK